MIVVGGGPAGLSAALLLGRCRRRTLVVDAGRGRNAASDALWGFLTRDGTPPSELRRLGREQLERYPAVELREGEVVDACRDDGGFAVTLHGGERLHGRKLLLATGVVDEIPDIEGLDAFYGKSVHHCPYCDGWQLRDRPVAVYGRSADAVSMVLEMTVWTRDLTLCTDGALEVSEKERGRLQRHGIALREERVRRLEGTGTALERVVFDEGEPLSCDALFFKTGQSQRCDLPERLGCDFTEKGTVATGAYEATNVPGLYVAGDASPTVQLAIIAAAEGAQAAFAINTALLREDLAREGAQSAR